MSETLASRQLQPAGLAFSAVTKTLRILLATVLDGCILQAGERHGTSQERALI